MTLPSVVIVDGVAVDKTTLRAWMNSPDSNGDARLQASGLITIGTAGRSLNFSDNAPTNIASVQAYNFDGTVYGLWFRAWNGTALTNMWAVRGDGSFRPAADNTQPIGNGSFRISVLYAGTGTINTSDEREKEQIGEIPDAWLDAWGDVEWCRFKFREAVEGKGKRKARYHIGAVAQAVQRAFEKHNLDAAAIGLLCFDKWPAEGDVPAGDRWGLRYDECFAMEAAYQRRGMARLEARLDALAPV